MFAIRSIGQSFYWSVVWPVEKALANFVYFVYKYWPFVLMIGWFTGIIVAVKVGKHVDGLWVVPLLPLLFTAYWWYDKYLPRR